MRNLRKLTAVVVAIALVLTSMTAAFAASTSYEFEAQANTLKDLGIWEGSTDGDLMLGKDLTRAEGAVLVLKLLFGKTDADQEAADTAALDKFADVDEVPAWAEGWLALAVANGVVKGSEAKDGSLSLNADSPLLGKDLASMFMNALGFADENEYGSAAELLAEKSKGTILAGIAEDIENEALTRDVASAVVFDTLTATAKDATKTVIETYVGSNAELKAIAQKAGLIATPTELAVESIEAPNLREVLVKFNKKVDSNSAQVEGNYMNSSDTAQYIEDAILQEDGQTVKLLIKDGTENQTTLDFEIKNVKDESGVVLASTYTKSLNIYDAEVPKALSYKFTGPDAIEVTYSEPIDTTASAATLSAMVDDGIYGTTTTVTNGGYVVNVELGSPLSEGAHKLVIKGALDFAHYTSLDKTFDMTYTKDTTVPTATVEVTQTEIKFTFNKPVKGLGLKSIYHTYSSYIPYTLEDPDRHTVEPDQYYSKVTASFDDGTNVRPLPAGTSTKVVLVADAGDDGAGNDLVITDRYGNVLPGDLTFNVTVTADTTAPVITGISVENQKEILISYSESMKNWLDAANFVVKKADGTVVSGITVTDGTADGVTKTKLVSNDDLSGSYTVTVSNLTDKSLYANPLGVQTVSFTVNDLTGITKASYDVSDDGRTLYVTYPEAMATTGTFSVLNKDNYLIGTTADSATKISNASISVWGSADKVKIVLDTAIGGNKLFIKNVADVAGNLPASLYIAATDTLNNPPVITDVKTIALNKLEITVDRQLSTINAANIVVDGTTVAAVSYTNKTDDGKPISVITATLKDSGKLSDGAALPATIAIVKTGATPSTNIKSLTGKEMADTTNALPSVIAAGKLKDGVAPVVSKVYFVTSKAIVVVFDETIDPRSVTSVGKNGFSVAGGTLDGVIVTGKYAILYNDDKDFTKYTDVIYTAGVLGDIHENAIASFTHTDTLVIESATVTIPADVYQVLVDNRVDYIVTP